MRTAYYAILAAVGQPIDFQTGVEVAARFR
jgi:hypothetical protein